MRHHTRADLRGLSRQLGGEVYGWLVDQNDDLISHGRTTLRGNELSVTYYLPAGTEFRVGWMSPGRGVTAVCMLLRPPLPGQTDDCCVMIHIMEKSHPDTQFQSSQTPVERIPGLESGWFSGPPPFASGFLRLEIYRAIRDPTGGLHLTDPSRPALVMRFMLVGLAPALPAAPEFTRSHCPSPEPVRVLPFIHQISQRESAKNDCAYVQPQSEWSNTNTGNPNQPDSIIDMGMAAAIMQATSSAAFRKEYWM
ncbi:hypothetical protein DFH09DRAFT_1470021 [Mycena vulgaris]|nr:hypothetical protein DFH09DRAFT_1470021 [Mycena vulgaris]